jgi:hypothetical protein
MKIKLIRSGGFIPVTKVAETEANLTDTELVKLLEIIQHDPVAARIKDGNYFELKVGDKSTQVDLNKVPDKYKALFSKLKGDLKIMKKG